METSTSERSWSPWQFIKVMVLETDTKAGRAFDIYTQVLIVLSVVTFSIETLPNVDREIWQLLHYIEVFCVASFTFEYTIRLLAAKHKAKFVFSFFGLIDLIAILPFYLTTGLDLRSIRALRLLRITRLLKLTRYNQAMQRYTIAFKLIKEELLLFVFAASILVYISAVGIYYFEQSAQPDKYTSVFHSLWWAVGTLTTVAYGDVYPVTVGGKLFTVAIIILGLGIVAVPTGLFASALSKARELENS